MSESSDSSDSEIESQQSSDVALYTVLGKDVSLDCELPAGFTEQDYTGNEGGVCMEDINTHTSFINIQIPQGFNVALLNSVELPEDEGTVEIEPEKQDMAYPYKWLLEIKKIKNPSRDPLTTLLPSRETGSWDFAGNFEHKIMIKRKMEIPEIDYDAIPKKQYGHPMPDNLKQRYVPFGASEPKVWMGGKATSTMKESLAEDKKPKRTEAWMREVFSWGGGDHTDTADDAAVVNEEAPSSRFNIKNEPEDNTKTKKKKNKKMKRKAEESAAVNEEKKKKKRKHGDGESVENVEITIKQEKEVDNINQGDSSGKKKKKKKDSLNNSVSITSPVSIKTEKESSLLLSPATVKKEKESSLLLSPATVKKEKESSLLSPATVKKEKHNAAYNKYITESGDASHSKKKKKKKDKKE